MRPSLDVGIDGDVGVDVAVDIDVTGVRVERDVVFAEPLGFRPLALDLYLPPGPAALTCLYLHGGGWRVGSRRVGPGPAASWSPSFFALAAAHGIAVASVDYRLSGEARFPAQLEDVLAAAQFLDAQRERLDLPAVQAVWGSSAGGHLAALHALTTAGGPHAVRAAVCWYPPTDLDALSVDVTDAGGDPDRTAQSREGRLVGGPLDARRDLVTAASPVHHVPAAPPPFLFVHGSADISVPPRQSARLVEALHAAGGTAQLDVVPGASHMFPELDRAATLALLARSVRFVIDPTG